MRIFCGLAVVAAFALSTPAWAASPAVGEDAPDFGDANWVLNEPLVSSVAELRGDVIFIEKWGVKCGPCLALIPHVQKLHEQLGDKGLHIFAFEAQNHSAEETRDTAASRGCRTYPVATGGAHSYQTGGGIPHAWIIGVDGKVKWTGNPGDSACDRILREELAKVKFPGLGLLEVDRALASAAKSWLKGDLGGARADARELLEEGDLEAEVKAQAEQVIARADAKAQRLQAKADALQQERRYGEAIALLNELSDAYRRAPEGEAAEARLKELKKDKDVRHELTAAATLERLLGSLERKPAEIRRAQLEAFAASDKFAGTRAAEDAKAASAR